MARIRSIKPQFFRHRRLFLAESESGLPLRVAFAGLWTVTDREGRFRFEPDELKLDCLPYDDVNFLRVLDALTAHGFIAKYQSGRRAYGFIPGFKRHQVINNHEAESVLPPPDDITKQDNGIDAQDPGACATRKQYVMDLHERNKEMDGKEERKPERNKERKGVDARLRRALDHFEEFWKEYPKREGANPKTPARRLFLAALKAGEDARNIIRAAKNYSAECARLKLRPRMIA